MQETRDKSSGDEAPGFDQSTTTVAEILRTGREKRGQDLRSVANVLRIRYVFLEAIERGDFASLPGDTYAYGFVRTYADYLNLDKEEIVRQFKQEVESYGARKTLVFPTPVPESKTPGLAILLISILLLAVAYGGWTAVSRFDIELPDWVPFISKGESTDAVEGGSGASSVGESNVNTAGGASSEEVEIAAEVDAGAETVDVLPPEEIASEENTANEVTSEVITAPAVTPAAPEIAENATISESASSDLSVVSSEALSPTTPVAPEVNSSISDNNTNTATNTDAGASEELGVGAEANEVGTSDETNEVASAVVTPPPPPEPEVFGDEGVASAISILAEQDAWIHIVDASGEAIFSRVLRAGSVYNVPKREGLIMTTGNAGGIVLKVNGKDLPRIGPIGDVKRNIELSEDGLLASIQAE